MGEFSCVDFRRAGRPATTFQKDMYHTKLHVPGSARLGFAPFAPVEPSIRKFLPLISNARHIEPCQIRALRELGKTIFPAGCSARPHRRRKMLRSRQCLIPTRAWKFICSFEFGSTAYGIVDRLGPALGRCDAHEQSGRSCFGAQRNIRRRRRKPAASCGGQLSKIFYNRVRM